jgi:hypothetical protein
MKITKKIMIQYEKVRQGGLTNMFSYYNVMEIANINDYYELGSLTKEEYVDILSNYGKYMKEFNLKQDKSIWEEE